MESMSKMSAMRFHIMGLIGFIIIYSIILSISLTVTATTRATIILQRQ